MKSTWLLALAAIPLIAQEPKLTNSIGMQFVLIKPGTMQVGVFHPTCPSPNSELHWTPQDYKLCGELVKRDASPGFPVTIKKPYYMGRYEVTQAQWKKVMGNNPSVFQGDDHPVDSVTWQDAQAFIHKLNETERTNAYRLPSEFEWEYAGRAGGSGQSSWTDIRKQAVEGMGGSASPTTMPVGSKEPNAWGLYDMLGNVWEWVEDRYNEKLFPDPVPPTTGVEHVLKGGGFASDVKNTIYATHAAGPGDGWDVGFRIVRDVPQANEGGFAESERLDPAAVARGKKIFQPTCGFCHGADARGGAAGGPDLARSGVVLGDMRGEELVAFLKVGRPTKGMPAFNLEEQPVKDLAAFLHSVVEEASAQPESSTAILVGDAEAGKAFFNKAGKCANCHSVTGNFKGIGARLDPMTLQGRLVLPVGDGGYPGAEPSAKPTQTATVAEPSGQVTSGTLLYISDFAVTVRDSAGVRHTFTRDGNQPKVEVKDSLQAHLDLQPKLTDKQMHDLTAYLATLK